MNWGREERALFQPEKVPISRLELSARASEILFADGETLRRLDYMTRPIADEILACCREYLREHEEDTVMSAIGPEETVSPAEASDEPLLPAEEQPEKNEAPLTQDTKDAAAPESASTTEQQTEVTEPEVVPESAPIGTEQTDSHEPPQQSILLGSTAIPIEALGLSVRSFNCLKRAKINTAQELMGKTEEELLSIRNLGRKSAEEIAAVMSRFDTASFLETDASGNEIPEAEPSDELAPSDEEIPVIVADDRPIEALNLSVRSYNCLKRAKIKTVQQLLDISSEDLIKIRNLGRKSLEELEAFKREYVPTVISTEKQSCTTNIKKRSYTADELKELILAAYNIPFKGFSFQDFKDALPNEAADSDIKKAVGSLLAEGKLEYVDFRCYLVYPSFYEYFEMFLEGLLERDQIVMRRRYTGYTLDAIAQELGITRERVRQIQKKNAQKALIRAKNLSGKNALSEDFYAPLYSSCEIPDAFWTDDLGLSQASIHYLEGTYEKGKKKPEEVLGDESIPVSLRYRLRSFLDRDKLRIDGKLFPRSRPAIEEYALRKYARDELEFDRFVELYNGLLTANSIPFDEKLYYAQENNRYRSNRFADSMFCLWKQGERLRWYDIQSRDYSELLDALSLNSYQNTELSTRKFMELYPKLMEKYDLRDPYELHNLLKKISTQYGLDFVKFSRQPILQFGKFDRLEAIKTAIISLSPVSQIDLVDYLYQEYGYDKATAVGYLTPFSAYYHNGIYTAHFKRIPEDRTDALMEKLSEDFYFSDEIKAIYASLFRDADLEEINPYTLKNLGFVVNSGYALQNHPSASAYFTHLLTKDDVYDVRDILNHYGSIQMFNQTYSELLKNHQIFLFEKDQIITLRRMEKLGITEENIEAYCEAVRDFVEDNTYFTLVSLRQDGFTHPLEQLGFDDYFYVSLLGSSEGFSSQRAYGSIVLYRGERTGQFSRADFLVSLLREYESVDLDEFIGDVQNRFGVSIPSRFDVTQAVHGSELYYDSIMDKIYRNKELYYSDFDE